VEHASSEQPLQVPASHTELEQHSPPPGVHAPPLTWQQRRLDSWQESPGQQVPLSQ